MTEIKTIPRILIAACASGSGKTTVTCGLLAAFKNRGIQAASFKCGPDYIDPMFHSQVLGTKSRNLDLFFTDEETTRYLLCKNSEEDGIAVMEGVMGYYDGLGGSSTEASSYHLACATDTPVILVANCRGMSVSVLAQIKGFLQYRKDSHIAGVIFNQMSPGLYEEIAKRVESELGIRALGYFPKMEECSLESRHLGLVTAAEVADLREKTERLAGQAELTMDLDGILAVAKQAPAIAVTHPEPVRKITAAGGVGAGPKIAVARDRAFCFYYQDSLELLEELGAELVDFSPLADRELPEGVCGLLLGGGYPELCARELSENREMLKAVRSSITSGMPCIAECGGFMYLHQRLIDEDGRGHQLAGVIDATCYPTGKLQRFGYITLTANQDSMLCAENEQIRAHEFHYWDSTQCGDGFTAEKPTGRKSWDCIHGAQSLFAGFPHIYFYSNPSFARRFVEACRVYGEGKQG